MDEELWEPLTREMHTKATVSDRSWAWKLLRRLAQHLPTLAPEPLVRFALDETLGRRTSFPHSRWKGRGFNGDGVRPYLQALLDLANLPNDHILPEDSMPFIFECCDCGSLFGEQLMAKWERIAGQTLDWAVMSSALSSEWDVGETIRALKLPGV